MTERAQHVCLSCVATFSQLEQSLNPFIFPALTERFALQESLLPVIFLQRKDPLLSFLQINPWVIYAFIAFSILLLAMLTLIYVLYLKLRKKQASFEEMHQRIVIGVNKTQSLILSLSETGQIRLINEAARQFLKKWTGKTLNAGDNLLKDVSDENYVKVWRSWMKKAESVDQWKEVSQIKLQKQNHYLMEHFSSIRRADGKFAGLVMVSNDITREHEYNVQLSTHHDELEKSNKAKERMLSILAHDLKDAIYSAQSLSELVCDTPEQFEREELVHLFNLLHQNFSNTRLLLDGLLDWMKTQTGALEANPAAFTLKKVVDEVFGECKRKAHEKELNLIGEVSEKHRVLADKEMIKTVLRNLITNAIKFSETGKGTVQVFEDVHDNEIVIHVKDNGRGISLLDKQKIFQGPGMFSTKGTANEQGTGFGISLCRELLKLNGSKLQLESSPGEGSDFFFALQLAKSEESVAE